MILVVPSWYIYLARYVALSLFLDLSLKGIKGSIKKGNRHSEILLRDLEHVSTLASLYKSEYAYPKGKIDENWEKVLLNQCMLFSPKTVLVLMQIQTVHDVLPGSAM